MRSARVDLYGLLGVARSATAGELRRAYRQMALAHHPDRAGASSAATFAGIADAYKVLSNPVARSAYDASLADNTAWQAGRHATGPVHTGGLDWTVATTRWKTRRPIQIPDLLQRVSGRIEDLVAARVVIVATDGSMDLHLNGAEAASGGTAAIQMPLKVLCATCGGVARPRGVWCRTCQHDGQVTEEVTAFIRIPQFTHPGSMLSTPIPRAIDSPLRTRIFVHGLRPYRG